MDPRPLHPEKVLAPIEVSVLGSVILVKPVQLENKDAAKLVMVAPSIVEGIVAVEANVPVYPVTDPLDTVHATGEGVELRVPLQPAPVNADCQATTTAPGGSTIDAVEGTLVIDVAPNVGMPFFVLKRIDCKAVHPLNEFAPITVTDAGSEMLARHVHPENVSRPSIVVAGASVTAGKAVHVLNSSCGIDFIVAGIVTLFKPVHPLNTFVPKSLTEAGIVKLASAVHP